jgi:hypothetical protein
LRHPRSNPDKQAVQTSGETSAARGFWRNAPWLVFLVLVAIAFAWRMPYAATKPIVQVDEVQYSLPTVQRFLAGDPVFYIAGTNYGAPVEQAIAAVLFGVFGESAAAFRLSTLLLGCIAIGISFLALRRVTGDWPALGIALLLALGNSSVARYTTFSHGCYATLFVVVGCIQLATMWTDEKRTGARWLILGMLMGAGMYVLKLALFQSLASLAWLWLRSDYFRRLRERLGDPHLRQRMLVGLVTVAAGLLALSPVLYRYLTRRATFAITPLERGIVIAAAFLGAAGAAIILPTLCAPRLREWLPVACCGALLVLIPLPAELWFQKIERPRLAAQEIEPYAEAAYSFKHVHEWPNQARLIIEGVFPALLIGRWDEVRGYEERVSLGWKSAVAAAVLAALAFAGFRRCRSGAWRPGLPGADFIFIAPFFLTLLVLFPSWSLHSASSYRYLLPFLPGFCLLAYRCVEDRITAHPRVLAVLFALYVVYCAADCFHHIVKPVAM